MPPDREGGEVALMCARAGEHRLLFDLRTLLSIEGAARIEHEAIRGPIDLRRWLGTPGEGEGESLLALGDDAVYRILVDHVTQLDRGALRRVHPIPSVMSSLGRRLCLRGVVELEGDGLGFLVDPRGLARAAQGAEGLR